MEAQNQESYKSAILKVQDLDKENYLVDFELTVKLEEYQNYIQNLKQKSIFFLVLDRTMSMRGYKLDKVKEATKFFMKKFYNKHKQERVAVILFDHKIKIVEPQQNFESFCEVLDNEYTPGASAVFYRPLQHINEIVKSQDLRQVKCIFITDGDDMYQDKTSEQVQSLKEYFTEFKIHAKFSIIGIGEHDSRMTRKIVELSTDYQAPGPYLYITSKNKKVIIENIIRFTRDCKKQSTLKKGIIYRLQNDIYIKAYAKDLDDDDNLRLQSGNIVVNKMILNQLIETRNEFTVKSEKLKVSVLRNQELVDDVEQRLLTRLNEFYELEFDLSPKLVHDKISKLIYEIAMETRSEGNILFIDKVSHILKDLQTIERFLQRLKVLNNEYLYDHEKGVFEAIRNQIMRRQDIYANEYIISRLDHTSTDHYIQKLYERFTVLKQSIIMLRADHLGKFSAFKITDLLTQKLQEEGILLNKKKNIIRLQDKKEIVELRLTVKKFFIDAQQKLEQNLQRKAIRGQHSNIADQTLNQSNSIQQPKVYDPTFSDYQMKASTIPETIFEMLDDMYQQDLSSEDAHQSFVIFDFDQRDVFDKGYKMFREKYPMTVIKFSGVYTENQTLSKINQSMLKEQSFVSNDLISNLNISIRSTLGDNDEIVTILNEYGKKITARVRTAWFR
ncbi:UNKNOWN [Stylonychia lemnae]|uniref:VWFA domain-containing protein n=1 Tax=Stylonychia lemnae TaxID=5949 RepID=A0A078AV07_STYLE|nr:UNKNOWN [Stylonychia lemnae]|eukprot:CDW85831.1 UNKNOWN [Stylonychia lemnae]